MSLRHVALIAPQPRQWRYLQILLVWISLVVCYYMLSVHKTDYTVTLRHLDKLYRYNEELKDSYENIATEGSNNNETVNTDNLNPEEIEWMAGNEEKQKEVYLFPDGDSNPNIDKDVNAEIVGDIKQITRESVNLIDVPFISNDDEENDDDEDSENLLEENSEVLPSNVTGIGLGTDLRRHHWTIAEAGHYSADLFSPPPNEIPAQRFPTAIIIGAGKCGTRALVEFMRMHPYITATGSEVHFFDVEQNYKKGYEWYRSKMPYSYSNQVTIEKTPSYMWSDRALEEIYKLNKSIKLIVILKDPVSRVESQIIRGGSKDWSLQRLLIRENGRLQVNDRLNTVHWGCYAYYLKKWMKKYPREQIHIIEAGDFTKDPAKEIVKLEQFLEIPHRITWRNFYFNATRGFFCMKPFHIQEIQCLSPGKGRPHAPQDPKVKNMFYDFYRSHNEELFKLLGRRFQWEPKA